MPCTRPHPFAVLLLATLTLLTTLAWSPAPEDPPALAAARAEARGLLARGAHTDAVAAFAAITERHPDDAVAWFELAQAHHMAGDDRAAHDHAERAAAIPSVAPSALDNMACASALLGDADAAEAELRRALDAGFLDFGLIATDADPSGEAAYDRREVGRKARPDGFGLDSASTQRSYFDVWRCRVWLHSGGSASDCHSSLKPDRRIRCARRGFG